MDALHDGQIRDSQYLPKATKNIPLSHQIPPESKGKEKATASQLNEIQN